VDLDLDHGIYESIHWTDLRRNSDRHQASSLRETGFPVTMLFIASEPLHFSPTATTRQVVNTTQLAAGDGAFPGGDLARCCGKFAGRP